MIFERSQSARKKAQDLMWQAMEIIGHDNGRAADLCRQALRIYSNCVDALTMLAELELDHVRDYIEAMRHAVQAGRQDLGSDYFKHERGNFWLLIETRPLMRAMAQLVDGLLQWGTAVCIDEAIEIQEEMLALNPNDNQGMRDTLTGCYLQRKRYNDAETLLKRYENNWMAVPCWARVLLAHTTGYQKRADSLLAIARKQNPQVELYLTNQKRRPRQRPDYYSPGDDTEAIYCADTLWEAWKKHPKAKQWLKSACT
ncbi:hypothetical protein HED60_13925 [Planctomycetales bacterium ZRK34]|nr:hypothetical protein HED60_13925 [Planctomycetales bacterium ZRK34]